METLLSTGQVARLLGLQAHRIEYAHSTGRLQEPVLRFLGKRVFTLDDVQRVARYFRIDIPLNGNSAQEAP